MSIPGISTGGVLAPIAGNDAAKPKGEEGAKKSEDSLIKDMGSRMVGRLTQAVDRVGDGATNVAQGIATGDKSKIAKGAGEAAMGGITIASHANPVGLATGVALESGRKGLGMDARAPD